MLRKDRVLETESILATEKVDRKRLHPGNNQTFKCLGREKSYTIMRKDSSTHNACSIVAKAIKITLKGKLKLWKAGDFRSLLREA